MNAHNQQTQCSSELVGIGEDTTCHHDEVVVVFVGEDGALPLAYDIIVYPRGKSLRQISYMSANCDQ